MIVHLLPLKESYNIACMKMVLCLLCIVQSVFLSIDNHNCILV